MIIKSTRMVQAFRCLKWVLVWNGFQNDNTRLLLSFFFTLTTLWLMALLLGLLDHWVHFRLISESESGFLILDLFVINIFSSLLLSMAVMISVSALDTGFNDMWHSPQTQQIHSDNSKAQITKRKGTVMDTSVNLNCPGSSYLPASSLPTGLFSRNLFP